MSRLTYSTIPAIALWTTCPSIPLNNRSNSIKFGAGNFVAVSTSATINQRVLTSSDGLSWTANADTDGSGGSGLIRGSTNFAMFQGSPNTCAYSSDGVIWFVSTTSSVLVRYITGFAYGNGIMMGAASFDGGSGFWITTSSDEGVNWTDKSGGLSFPGTNGLAYGNVGGTTPTWVISTANFPNSLLYSTNNGTSWSIATNPSGSGFRAVSYDDTLGLFVALGDSNKAVYSSDGVTWYVGSITGNFTWSSITPCNGGFVAVANSGTGVNRSAFSSDGINWNLIPTTGTYSWSCITYSQGLDRLVAGASDDVSGGMIYISASKLFQNSWTCPAGVTEVTIQPIDSSVNPTQASSTVTVVPNTTYISVINSSSYSFNNPNTLGSIFTWSGSSNLLITWTE